MSALLPADTAWLVPHLDPTPGADPSRAVRCWLFALAPGGYRVRTSAGHELQTELIDAARYGERTIYARFVDLTGLAPDTVYELSLLRQVNERVLDRALVRTWPTALGGSERPFRLFLGSCFATRSRTRGGNQVGGLVNVLRKRDAIPHLKLLCGDQVYLDSPVAERVPDSEPQIRQLLLDKYLTNWGAREPSTSQFGALLRTGSNLMLSDDHEFWNNYPMPAIYAPRLAPLLGGAERAGWFVTAARELLAQFQGVPPLFRHYQLAGVSLIALDGRRRRSATRAHPPELLRQLAGALAQARGPVLLVLGQPLFEPAAARRAARWVRSHITDLTLADLDDYRELVQLIAKTGKDVMVLSGDIHGGRVTSVRSARQNIFEVVSSPLSLVTPSLRYRDELPTDEYPDLPGTHPKYTRIMAQQGPVTGNQGALLCLSRRGDALDVTVEFMESHSGTKLKPPGLPSFTLRSLS